MPTDQSGWIKEHQFWNEQHQIAPPLNHVWHFISVCINRIQPAHRTSLTVLLCGYQNGYCMRHLFGQNSNKTKRMWWFWSTRIFPFNHFFSSFQKGCITVSYCCCFFFNRFVALFFVSKWVYISTDSFRIYFNGTLRTHWSI